MPLGASLFIKKERVSENFTIGAIYFGNKIGAIKSSDLYKGFLSK